MLFRELIYRTHTTHINSCHAMYWIRRNIGRIFFYDHSFAYIRWLLFWTLFNYSRSLQYAICFTIIKPHSSVVQQFVIVTLMIITRMHFISKTLLSKLSYSFPIETISIFLNKSIFFLCFRIRIFQNYYFIFC